MTEPPDMEKRPHYLELERLGEQYYEEMYDGRVRGRWSDVKECLDLAIVAAEREGLSDEAERLRKRLEHIRKVVYSQFS
jgi:hypothetical protein